MTHSLRQLQTLLQGIDVRRIAGDVCVPVSGIAYDSRQVNPGDLFVAIPGLEADGHQFIEQAAAQGAVAAVVSQPVEETRLKAIVEVDSTRRALAFLAANYFDHPSKDLSLIGITGTNGKTTLTYLLEQIFIAAGRVPGIIGTVGARYPGFEFTMGHTTPEAPDLQQLFCQMVKAGVNISAMEVSSHALDLERTRGCHFRLAVFINLSRDHLDYHGDLDKYAQAKSLLFSRELNDSQAEKKVAVVNSDDPRCTQIIEGWHGQ
ncbi:MAG: UDP-N-acetylmuramoyl-L-alanyl-D-glutamate--2,6-diaminopimelate ligase, partial [Deltaproteobacteria bacterium]|nr:UDP-N-acetylmuramoyl-L-alanyl-D-glutamate--2,6-diaminopimelate ligase [Deltaproteobacteria bacterium]